MRYLPFFLLLLTTKAYASFSVSGSSTVYPFAIVIAQEFSHRTGMKPPIVESVGTGGGFSAFCSGNGKNYPDIVNASRKIKHSETKRCMQNNVAYKPVTIGLDAIVLAIHSNTTGKNVINSLTEKELFKAFARNVIIDGKIVKNPYKKWSQIRPSLPNNEIIIYGPPSTSGTRDAFTEIILTEHCMKLPEFHQKFKEKTKKFCSLVRNDGQFIEAGENDAFIVHKISLRNGAIGIFGYGHYMENRQKLHAIKVNNIAPMEYTISSRKYKIARPLFLYFKKSSLKESPAVREFYEEATSQNAIGNNGYLKEYHLIPLDKKNSSYNT